MARSWWRSAFSPTPSTSRTPSPPSGCSSKPGGHDNGRRISLVRPPLPEAVRRHGTGGELHEDDQPKDDPESPFDRLVAKGLHPQVGAEAPADHGEEVQDIFRHAAARAHGPESVVAGVGAR